MSKLLPALAALLLAACHPGELAEDVTAATVGWTVEAGKGVVRGVQEGVVRGRTGAASADGANVIADPETAHAALGWEVLDARTAGDVTVVRLSVQNRTDAPVRVAVLSRPDTLLVDADGFAHPVVKAPGHALGDAVDVPPSAKVAVEVAFDGGDLELGAVRVAGVEVPWAPAP